MAASASGLRQGQDLLTGQGDQDGAGAWGEGDVEAAVRSDEDSREVVRTTGDELRSRRAAEAETGVGSGRGRRDELIGLAGAWTRRDSEGDSFGRGRRRQWTRSGRTGLLASFQVASRGAGILSFTWVLSWVRSWVLDSLDQTGRRVGQQGSNGAGSLLCIRTGYGKQSASLFLLGLGGGRLDGSGRERRGGVVNEARSSIAGSLLTAEKKKLGCRS